MELRALAERRLLPAAAPAGTVARGLRAGLRHGRGERDVLPAAARDLGRALGGGIATGIPVRQGVPLPDAHQAPARSQAGAGAIPRLHRAAGRLTQARPDPLAAAAENFKRDDERLARALERLPPEQRHAFEFRDASWFQPDVYELRDASCRARNRRPAGGPHSSRASSRRTSRSCVSIPARAAGATTTATPSSRNGRNAGVVEERCDLRVFQQ